MMRRLGSLAARRWRRLTGTASGPAVALGLLACLCTVVAVVGPRAAAQLRTAAFRQFITAAPAADKAVIGSVTDNTLNTGKEVGLSAAQIKLAAAQLRQHLRGLPLAPAAADWSSLTSPQVPVTVGAGSPALRAVLPPKIELSYRDTLAANARLVAGRLPAGSSTAGPDSGLVQVAVTAAVARRFGVAVGSRLPLPGTGLVLAVTGIVQPRDPAAPFWTADPVVATPALTYQGSYDLWIGGAFIGASGVSALQFRVNLAATQVSWNFPLNLGRLTGGQAGGLRQQLAGALATAGHLTGIASSTITHCSFGTTTPKTKHGHPGGFHNSQHCTPSVVAVPLTVTMTSGTLAQITSFQGEAGSVGSVLALLAVSLAVLAAAVVLLAACLLAERRRAEFAVLRARGAARRQLAASVLGGCALAVLPGAAAGAAIGVAITPGAGAALAWWLAGLEVVAALAGPVLVTVWVQREYAFAARPDQSPGRLAAARRLVIETGFLLCAAGGLVVLREQGAGSSPDLYPSAAPALLAIGVAVIVMRLYPLLVRGLLRLSGRRAGATAFVGLARASRASGSAMLPAFAMVLALALVAFAGMLRGAVIGGESAASYQQAGADAVISSTTPLGPALQRAVAAMPGVHHVAAADLAVGTVTSAPGFSVLLVNPAQYAAVIAASPLPRPPATFTGAGAGGAGAGGTGTGGAEPVPALASPALAAEIGHRPVFALLDGHQLVRVQVVGQAPSMSGVTATSSGYLVLNRKVAAGGLGSVLLVAGPEVSQPALRAAVRRYAPGATVVFRSRLLTGLQTTPLRHGTDLGLVLGAVAAACCGLLVLLLSLLLTATSRALALARMSTMGLSAVQARLLLFAELLPQLVAVLAGGLVCAIVLVPALGPALSLAVVTGSASSVPIRIEPAWLIGTAIALLVLAMATVSIQTMLTGRETPRYLRVGG